MHKTDNFRNAQYTKHHSVDMIDWILNKRILSISQSDSWQRKERIGFF